MKSNLDLPWHVCLVAFFMSWLAACGEKFQDVYETEFGGECASSDTRFEVAGAIRNDGAGWYVISDKHHAPINNRKIVTNRFDIQFFYTAPVENIHTFTVTPDGSLAKDYTAGTSVGVEKATIRLYSGGERIDPRSVATGEIPYSNLWVYGLFSANCEVS